MTETFWEVFWTGTFVVIVFIAVLVWAGGATRNWTESKARVAEARSNEVSWRTRAAQAEAQRAETEYQTALLERVNMPALDIPPEQIRAMIAAKLQKSIDNLDLSVTLPKKK